MQRDVAGMRRDVAGIRRDVVGMRRDVAVLVSATPDAALAHIDPPLVGQGLTNAESDAVRDGAHSTWTYMRDGGCKLAVGSAHCVLDYKIDDETRNLSSVEFVEIPSELKDRVTHAGFCGNYINVKSDAKDVAILILDKFPDCVDATRAIEWRAFDSQPPTNVHAKVGGLSLSGSVRGHGCYATSRTIRFVEDSGEGGQSGTLIFNISPQQGTKPYALGVYGGTRRTGFADMKKRGWVAKLPPLNKMRVHKIENIQMQARDILPLRKSNRRKSRRNFRSVDGFTFRHEKEHSISGLFVSKTYTMYPAHTMNLPE